LFEIFYTFDKDKDGALCPKELDHFVFSTNGQHPPISFIEQMGQRFGANEQGWLTQEGFMVNVWPLKKICYYKLNTME
jgi:Ca2+-binding EF-hand superfamily protein